MHSWLLIALPIVAVLSEPQGGHHYSGLGSQAGEACPGRALSLWSVMRSPTNECRLVKGLDTAGILNGGWLVAHSQLCACLQATLGNQEEYHMSLQGTRRGGDSHSLIQQI